MRPESLGSAQPRTAKARPHRPPATGCNPALRPRGAASIPAKCRERHGATVSTSAPGAKEKAQELPLQARACGSELQSVCKDT